VAYSVDQFNADLANPYAWPGGYPRFFLMNDGECLSFAAARDNAELIRESIANNSRDGWQVVACDVNWEDADMVCAHTGEPIECAYPPDAE
jgi:hypothetical protein